MTKKTLPECFQISLTEENCTEVYTLAKKYAAEKNVRDYLKDPQTHGILICGCSYTEWRESVDTDFIYTPITLPDLRAAVLFTIQDLREGRCAVKNDGTLEQLQSVLTAAGDSAVKMYRGTELFYYRNPQMKNWENGPNRYDLPSQSVSDFLLEEDEIKWGEECEARFNATFERATYVSKYPGCPGLHIVIRTNEIGQPFGVTSTVRRPAKIKSYTKSEIAARIGEDEDSFEIKN